LAATVGVPAVLVASDGKPAASGDAVQQ
jgi:hypothetical protein